MPVAGLTKDEFELLDNGVPQQIELMSVEAMPIDVSLALDTSDSIVANVAREHPVRCAVSTSLAFGGNDAALVMRAVG